ncbi:MAG: succinylglutamate desuccinylase/aspartoacylase family protein [Labilithrix sp.]|nr:succinylglutamate desuccinylase/aspartoacylase family protein [Labilithrix sp.]MCW5814931.1 succinylglutamate desuccinylase/aspartoacylase family protein [Labilithrix sp.]
MTLHYHPDWTSPDLAAAARGPDVPAGRIIGQIVGEHAGPTLIVVCGIHGNERAGVLAAKRVFATLERRKSRIRGEIVAISGNLAAMRLGLRHQVRDLNRVWTDARVADLEERAAKGADLDAEDKEQLEMLREIRAGIARARGPVHLIDLHTTSAQGFPFILFGDTLRQRKFATAIPLPILMGLEEHLDGVLSAYWSTQGLITMGCEGGQHDDPGSVDNLEAVVLLGAESAGLFGAGTIIETSAAFALCERRRGDLPHIMEVISRRAITRDDEFVMEPGFANLAPVRAGRLLARDKNGEIRAPRDGIVILPLYQAQGSEGFFWGREISPARLRLSEALRKVQVDRFLKFLPGVERTAVAKDGKGKTRLTVDTKLAAFYPRDMFHLLGFRRIRNQEAVWLVERPPEG